MHSYKKPIPLPIVYERYVSPFIDFYISLT